MQIKEYKIIRGWDVKDCSDASDSLSAKVNEAILDGWEPLGGLACYEYSELAQPMVRRG
tara:strand:- start:5 stop:181 length:177 start_codon:yes stop_codon:yes gene_type:complete